MMKRWIAIVMACMLLLTGCGGKKGTSSDTQTKVPPAQETAAESEKLAAFRKEIPDSSAQIAAAYLGYVELTGYEDLTVYLEANGFYDIYPFLSELTEEQFVQQEGGELYVIVPASKEISLTVYDCFVDETDYVMARGNELLKLEAGQPVILQGNVSEVEPNLWVAAETDVKEPLEYVPCLSMMGGQLERLSGVYDFSDYEYVLAIWSGVPDEIPVFCDTWYAQATDGDGELRSLKLNLWSDGFVEYSYGIPESDILESFEGYWGESDGVLTLDLSGGPVSYDGNDMSDYTYTSLSSFEWDYQSRHLYLSHASGDVLLYGTEGNSFEFLPFNPYPLAGTWTTNALTRDWTYDLSLLENGECWFRISEAGEEVAFYEGWWSMTEDFYVSLDLGLSSGQHPENPEMEFISGTYRAEVLGEALEFSFVSGGILTLDMEESGYDTFTQAVSSCVSVHYAEDVSVDWSTCDWVIVDDTEPVEAAFCTMVPVEDFTVVSLFLQESGEDGELYFDVTELFDYGTLTPDRPLSVTLTIYGTMPSYGISFTDPSGAYRLYGVTMSGMDGSLELMEIN